MKSVLSLLLITSLLAGCSASRQYFTDEKVIGPYTPAVKVGNLLYVSGQIAMKPGTTEFAGEDIEVQVRQVMENIKTVLARASTVRFGTLGAAGPSTRGRPEPGRAIRPAVAVQDAGERPVLR